MTPQQLINAAYQVQQRWPDADIDGFYGNGTVCLDVIVDRKVVAQVDCRTGTVHELSAPIQLPRHIVRFSGGGVSWSPIGSDVNCISSRIENGGGSGSAVVGEKP